MMNILIKQEWSMKKWQI